MHPSFPGLLPVIVMQIARSRPRWLLFVLGAAMILPVLLSSVIALPLAEQMSTPKAQIFTIAFIGSSLPEELMRYAVLYFVGLVWLGLSRPRDGIIFGLLVAFGFSCAENLYYGLTVGWATGILKLAIATPIHLALGVTMGCLLAVAGSQRDMRRIYLRYAFAAPVLMHGVYDLVVLMALANGSADAVARLMLPAFCYVLVVIIAVLSAMHASRRMRISTV